MGSSEERQECPRAATAGWPWLVSMSTGQVVAPACRTWRCGVCGPRVASRMARAIDAAGVDRWVTVTRAPSDLRQGVARLRYRLSRSRRWEWAWVAERSPQGMIHVHACVRGDYCPQTEVSRAARHAGFGRVADIRVASTAVAGYASKVAWYASKARLTGGWDEAIELNGGRLWHWSRGYTGGVPVRRWVRHWAPTDDRGPWVPTSAPARHRLI